jgi:hypothetical protein
VMSFCGEKQCMCDSCIDGKCTAEKCLVILGSPTLNSSKEKIEECEGQLNEELLPPLPPEESKSEWPKIFTKPELNTENLTKVNSEFVKEYISGKKDDGGKPRFSLLPWDALEKVVEVMEYGAKKYEKNNWRYVKDGYTRYIDAAYRHLSEMMQGKDLDSESGLTHIAHAATSLLFTLALRDR